MLCCVFCCVFWNCFLVLSTTDKSLDPQPANKHKTYPNLTSGRQDKDIRAEFARKESHNKTTESRTRSIQTLTPTCVSVS